MTARDPDLESDSAERSRAGLCANCEHARRIRSSKGSTFWLCERAATEPERFAKYPRLPVRLCVGFAKR